MVADYKTNALTPRGSVPVPDDYHPTRMAEAMVEHDYPLQALLYSVALHRYLRWRQPGYRPADHLGGVAYLFVRGMTGPDVAVTDGHSHGVFDWAVPPALVVALSDLLDGRAVTELRVMSPGAADGPRPVVPDQVARPGPVRRGRGVRLVRGAAGHGHGPAPARRR